MVSVQFLLVTSPSILFWASRALPTNLTCKETIVEKWLSLGQTRQLAAHIHLFLRSLIYSATALICLSASDISPEGSALLSHKSICVASTSSRRFPDCWLKCCSPSSLLNLAPCVLLVVAAAPVSVSHGSQCQGLGIRTYFGIYFTWALASFQLDKLCT